MGGESGDGALPEPAAMPEGGPDAGNCPQQTWLLLEYCDKGSLQVQPYSISIGSQQERQHLLPLLEL